MAVYLWQLSLPPQAKQAAITLLGFMPGVLFGHASIEGEPWVSPAGSIFTAMFLHGGFFHLAGNMIYLVDLRRQRRGPRRARPVHRVLLDLRRHRGAGPGAARHAVDGADDRRERRGVRSARRLRRALSASATCSSRCRSCWRACPRSSCWPVVRGAARALDAARARRGRRRVHGARRRFHRRRRARFAGFCATDESGRT